MHCLVFSQVSPRHFVQQSTRLRREHIVAVKNPPPSQTYRSPAETRDLIDNCSLVPLDIIWIINRYMLDIYADNTNNGWLCFSFLLSLFPLVKKSPGIIDIYQYSILIVAICNVKSVTWGVININAPQFYPHFKIQASTGINRLFPHKTPILTSIQFLMVRAWS